MASPAQIQANQANARRSTGPRTDQGKDASRRNALTHGMAARTLVLPDEEAEVIAARIVAWTPVWEPRNAYDFWLVEQVVVSSVQIERCQAHEHSLRTRQAARAERCWDLDRECDAEDLGASLAKAPATVARKLRGTKQGCAWLISRWTGLGCILEAKGGWDEAQTRLALDLLGTPKELRDGPTRLDGDRPALIREQVSALQKVTVGALDELDAHERADAQVGLGRDTDKAIALARRYEAACVRRMQWAQKQLPASRSAPSPVPVAPAPRPAPATVVAPVPVAIPEEESEAAELALLRAEFEEDDRMMAALNVEMDAIFADAATPPKATVAPRANRKARRALRAHARARKN